MNGALRHYCAHIGGFILYDVVAEKTPLAKSPDPGKYCHLWSNRADLETCPPVMSCLL